jgi:hypothetical protein
VENEEGVLAIPVETGLAVEILSVYRDSASPPIVAKRFEDQ